MDEEADVNRNSKIVNTNTGYYGFKGDPQPSRTVIFPEKDLPPLPTPILNVVPGSSGASSSNLKRWTPPSDLPTWSRTKDIWGPIRPSNHAWSNLPSQDDPQQARSGISSENGRWQPMTGSALSSVIENSIPEKRNYSSETSLLLSGTSASRLQASNLPSTGGLNGSVTSKQLPFCSFCGEPHIAESRCEVCKENLCKECVFAHQRVKLTRGHLIVGLKFLPENKPATTQLSQFDNLAISSPTPSHLPTTLQNHADMVRVYENAIEKAKAQRPTLISNAQQGITQIEEANANVKEMENRINTKYNRVLNDVEVVTKRYATALNERERVLIKSIEIIRQEKLRVLDHQRKKLASSRNILHKIIDQLMTAKGKDVEIINVCEESIKRINNVRASCGSLQVNEDDVVNFSPPDGRLLHALSFFGSITGSGFGPNTRAEGEGLRRGILGKDAKFEVIVKDQTGERRHIGGDQVMATITSPDHHTRIIDLIDCYNGIYHAVWKPQIEGEHIISVTVKGVDIHESPFKIRACTGRNYDKIGTCLFEFGGEGEGDGQLCRPWGVCCSQEGLILVANRSNNRIEIYTAEGKFHNKFGKAGKQNGQFDRPAGICCNSKDRVVVADKDNHRIQVFTLEGKFLMAFGERGSKLGQFNYPWDVACNSKDEILVSDTRNHRVQLFSPNGEFLSKYGFEGNSWKQFDSPRGVCFTSDDHSLVTDFNNHRFFLFETDFHQGRYLGKEGSADGLFVRPNGIAVDEEGNILVADSRNDRVQVFSSSGLFITKFGTKGTGPGEFDRPCGICISPKGQVIVVDFGNNRVQVF